MNMIGVKWFAEMEFWFALIKVLAIAAFLVVGTVFLGSGKMLAGNTTGFHLITDNGGFFPHGLLPALVLMAFGYPNGTYTIASISLIAVLLVLGWFGARKRVHEIAGQIHEHHEEAHPATVEFRNS